MPSKMEDESKRERHYDTPLKWKHIQEAITWAEGNMPELRRKTPAAA